MRVFRGALLAALIAWPAFVAGQLGPRVCLPGNDAGNGLELAVDAQGVAHLSRVDRVAGTLLYTRVARDGTKVDEVVARDISVLAVSEVEDTGLLLDGAVARICFHDRRAQRMHLASRVAGVWSLATLEEGIDGDGCDVRRLGDTLFVVYEAGGRLRLASSVKGGPFLVTNLDRVDGHRVGLRPSIALGPAGEVAVAHRDGTNRTLRVVWNAGGAWHFEVPDVGFNDAGFAPRAVFTAAGQLTIFHAIEAGDQGANTDRGLVRTTMSLGGALESVRLPVDGIGGTHGAAFGARGLAVVTREYYRSALFGSYDGLHLFLGNDLVHSVIETYTPATARHTFRFARIALDPFALPVIAFLDDFSPRFNNPGGAPVCLRWPADEDEDGLPDVAEDELGTDPADPDTDGDGRSDGDEVLVDGTDPLVGGCAPASEACNGVDDDCDGIVDEGEVSCGVGACAQTVAACAGGADNLCAPLPPATDDVTCDGVDDDCDGAVDEGQVTCGVGVCARTVAACVGGAANVCTPLPAAPDDSSCDGFDDDCDGAVDEDCCDDVCQANLVPDGDMESAEPWLLDRAPACIKSAAAAYSGARGLACGPGGGRAYQTGIALAPGALYTLRVRYRVRAGTVIGYLGYSAPGGFVTLSGTDLYAAAPVAEWTTFTRVFRAPDDLDRALTWLFVADGEADLDDVALTALADDESLVADPSFEDATVSWVRYTSTGCAPIEGEAYNGAGALVCGNPAAGTRIGGLPLREGALYRLAYAYRLDGAALYGYFGVRTADRAFVSTAAGFLGAYSPTAGWEHFDHVLRAPALAAGDAYEIIYYAKGGGRIDDVMLVELPPGASVVANGDFEGPAVAGWRRSGPRECVVNATAFEGAQAIRCTGDGAGMRQSFLPTIPNEVYRIGVAHAVSAGTGYVQVGVSRPAGFELLPSAAWTAVADGGAWHWFRGTFVAPDPGADDLRVVLSANGDGRFDALTITPIAAGDDLLGDGDFEFGAAGWRRYGAGACTVTAQGAVSGANRLRCVGRQGMRTSVPMVAGRPYRLTGRVEVTAASLWVFVGTWRGAQFTPVTGGSRRLDPTGGVVDYALDFTGPALAAGEDFQVIVYADGDAAVDAMRLVEVVE